MMVRSLSSCTAMRFGHPLRSGVQSSPLLASLGLSRRWAANTSPATTPSSEDPSRCPFSGPSPTTTTTTAAANGCPMSGNAATSCPVEEDDGVVPRYTSSEIVNQLGKARLSAFVTSTASAGYVLCGGTSLPILAALTAGTYIQSLSANTANQSIEIEYDRMMKRTHKRPLVIGAVSRLQAIGLSSAELAVGTGLLVASCGTTVAALGVANWALYVGVYTPLKRLSTTNTWWGAIVGAIPPVMGGVAATGSLLVPSPFTAAAATAWMSGPLAPAFLLGGVLFVWQIPHFMSLAFHCRRDYEKAGFKMLPFTHPTRSSVYAVSMSVVMAGLTLPGPALAGMPVEPWYYMASAVCNAGMVYKSILFHQNPIQNCRSCFVFSYMYLAVMLALLVANVFQPQGAVVDLYRSHVAPRLATVQEDDAASQ